MNSTIVLILLSPLVLAFVLFVPVLIRLVSSASSENIPSEWLENFSVASYYPMEGLLSDEDFAFLSRQPGFDLSLYRKLRRERLKIFKQYLDRAIVDFNRLHTTIRFHLPHVKEDCSDLATRLILLKLRFTWSVLRAEFSYRLCMVGFRSLAVRSLIAHLEEMNGQLAWVAAQAG